MFGVCVCVCSEKKIKIPSAKKHKNQFKTNLKLIYHFRLNLMSNRFNAVCQIKKINEKNNK